MFSGLPRERKCRITAEITSGVTLISLITPRSGTVLAVSNVKIAAPKYFACPTVGRAHRVGVNQNPENTIRAIGCDAFFGDLDLLAVTMDPEGYITRQIKGRDAMDFWIEMEWGTRENVDPDAMADWQKEFADPDCWQCSNSVPSVYEYTFGEAGSITFYRLTHIPCAHRNKRFLRHEAFGIINWCDDCGKEVRTED